MGWLNIIVLFVGGVLAASGFIVSKKPQAKELIAKLVPFQAGIGVAMLVIGLINILNGALGGLLHVIGHAPLIAIIGIAAIVCEIGVGFLLGFGLIAQWIPGEGSAEKKGLEIQQKLIKIQSPLGLVAIATSLLSLLMALGILTPL